jgi:mercuric ion transport protein
MNQNNLLRIGVAGTVVAALCCFTPILVILLGTIGLAALVGYLDYVLFPALAFFLALTIYALWRRQPAEDKSNDAKQ